MEGVGQVVEVERDAVRLMRSGRSGDDPRPLRQRPDQLQVGRRRQPLDLGCVDSCEELCRLHPCAVLDDNGAPLAPSSCPERCAALVADQSLVPADLPLVIDKAAENPGFCTCRACVSEDDAFCTQLFDCAIPAP